MTGTAKAMFLCGATGCPTAHLSTLINDGQYTNFNVPEGWHIQLGVWVAEETIVRCPEHCRFIGTSLAAGGHWEDDD